MAYLAYDKASGRTLVGVPARDLAREEFERFPKETQTIILKSGLYRMETNEEPEAERPPRKTARKHRE